MIPADAVEAAAKAMWDASDPVRKKARPTWESIVADPDWRRAVEYNRKDARVALEAAYPHLTDRSAYTRLVRDFNARG